MGGFMTALLEILHPSFLLMMACGAIGGILIGAMPGADFRHGGYASSAVYLWDGRGVGDVYAAGDFLRRHLWRFHHRHTDQYAGHAGLGRNRHRGERNLRRGEKEAGPSASPRSPPGAGEPSAPWS